MEKYFELQYTLSIIGLVIVGIIFGSFIICFTVVAIIYFYQSHSKKYEYDSYRHKYVRKEDKHN